MIKKFNLFCVVCLLIYGAVSVVVDFKNFIFAVRPENSARLFCWQNKVFVEFSGSASSWGTQLLDAEGYPMACPRRNNTEGKNYES